MIQDKSEIKKILVVSLTNIGDLILTFPVIDILKRDFPEAQLSIVIGPKSESLFEGNECFAGVYVFDKHQPVIEMVKWVFNLRKERFDLVVDLRNTAIGFLISPKYRTPFHSGVNSRMHMKEKHLNCLRTVYDFDSEAKDKISVSLCEEDNKAVNKKIEGSIMSKGKFVIIAPGAADGTKRWSERNFASLADRLIDKYNVSIVLTGGIEDRAVAGKIIEIMGHDEVVDFCGLFSLKQLAVLMKKSVLLIGNDSAPMHLASYLDVPVVALFGPTSPEKYGPWGKKNAYIKKEADCPVCRGTNAAQKHSCMNSIEVDDVFNLIKNLSVLDDE